MWVFVIGTDLLRELKEADWPTHTHALLPMLFLDKPIQSGSPSVCWEGSSSWWKLVLLARHPSPLCLTSPITAYCAGLPDYSHLNQALISVSWWWTPGPCCTSGLRTEAHLEFFKASFDLKIRNQKPSTYRTSVMLQAISETEEFTQKENTTFLTSGRK